MNPIGAQSPIWKIRARIFPFWVSITYKKELRKCSPKNERDYSMILLYYYYKLMRVDVNMEIILTKKGYLFYH
jgi:hypothetical protein